MSILIKGMEMPPDCLHCFMKHLVRGAKIINGDLHDMWYADCKGAFIATVYSFSGVIEVEGIRSDCPLVELPPHGRLIDADALIARIRRAKELQPELSDLYENEALGMLLWVGTEPTIIEAEEVSE